VYNPARIAGLIGTLKVKGDATPDRPHRRSSLLQVPNEFVPVTAAQLALLAGNKPEELRHQDQGREHQPATLLVQFLQERGITFRAQQPDANGITWYHLQQCPFHDDGRPFECGVGQKLPDGPYAGHCFHPEGQGKGWQEFSTALGLRGSAAPKVTQNEDDLGLTRRLADAIMAEDAFATDPGLRLYVFRDGLLSP